MLHRIRHGFATAAAIVAAAAAALCGSSLAPAGADARGEPDQASAFFAPGGGIEKAVVALLDGAREEALVAMYIFTSRPLSEAVIRAKRRGVDVRVLLDGSQRSIRFGKYADLRRAGVPVRTVSLGRTREGQEIKFHHKYLVVDGEIVETGSFNWTQQADDENHENAVIVRSRRLAAEFKRQFEKVWESAEADGAP